MKPRIENIPQHDLHHAKPKRRRCERCDYVQFKFGEIIIKATKQLKYTP